MTKPEAPKRKSNGRLGDAVWAAMRDEYVTGNESYADLAKRYGVQKTAVERHALNREANEGHTWGELRERFLADVSDRSLDAAGEALSKTLSEVREKSAAVARDALTQLATRVNSGTMEDKDLIQAAKLATTIKIELSNDPDSPLDVRRALDALSKEDLEKLASGADGQP